jgi:hypothetical protein
MTLQTRAAGRVPLEQIPPALRDRVRQVVHQPTLFCPGPAEAFAGRPDLYLWLLDHPDRAMRAWRRLGAKCTEIRDRGDGTFAWCDDQGSAIHWQTVFDDASRRVWYAEGKARPGPLLPSVSVQIVLVLRHGQRPADSEHTLLFHQAEVFVKTDSKAAAVIARILGPSTPRLAAEGLGQLELFFSGLVWYFDQHPERAEQLLADNRASRKG